MAGITCGLPLANFCWGCGGGWAGGGCYGHTIDSTDPETYGLVWDTPKHCPPTSPMRAKSATEIARPICIAAIIRDTHPHQQTSQIYPFLWTARYVLRQLLVTHTHTNKLLKFTRFFGPPESGCVRRPAMFGRANTTPTSHIVPHTPARPNTQWPVPRTCKNY